LSAPKQTLFGPITQLAYVTDDLETTAQFWSETTGVGPWTAMREVSLPATMNGKEVTFKIDVALAYQGDLQLEIIQPLCDSLSPYSANKEAGLWGLHHVQFTTNNMHESIGVAENAGLTPACIIEQGERGNYTYLRGPSVWFELMESNQQLQQLFDMIKAKGIDWDGKNIIQELELS